VTPMELYEYFIILVSFPTYFFFQFVQTVVPICDNEVRRPIGPSHVYFEHVDVFFYCVDFFVFPCVFALFITVFSFFIRIRIITNSRIKLFFGKITTEHVKLIAVN
jgi:hypothetical protein